MLNLEKKLIITDRTCKEPNLTHLFDEDDLTRIGQWCKQGFEQDEQSRQPWLNRMNAAMNLALQVQEAKTFPWPDASNIAIPLVTIAAMQFHSRAYPQILHSDDLVKYPVVGPDPQGERRARAQRISNHMSWQLLQEDLSWEEQFDRLLLNVPIVGCAFTKSYRDERGHNTEELVLARDLVMDYYAKSIDHCARKTHIIPTYRNEIVTRCLTGVYRDVTEEAWFAGYARPYTSQTVAERDNRVGVRPANADETTPFTLLEQHCWMDLDQDGFAEPYIVTFEYASASVVRLVARWERPQDILRLPNRRIVGFRATEYFTKYELIPSPDGGMYGLGFGILLGPLNEASNSIINQLVDSGTLSNTAGGFLGRGAKLKGGTNNFSPFSWNTVQSTGDDLRKDIVPLPVREPSAVLFQLLGLIMDYTNRVAGVTETMVGENPGQNTPATTTQTMVEQGIKIYGAIYKRIWRAMKASLVKRFQLNALFLPDQEYAYSGSLTISRGDYLEDPGIVCPSADPRVTSDMLRLNRAMALKQAAMTTPGYNIVEVEKEYLRALKVDGIEFLYPGPDKVPPLPNPKLQIEQLKSQVKQQELEFKKLSFVAQLQEEAKLNQAKIVELMAKAEEHLASADGVQAGHEIAAFEAAIGALKQHQDGLLRQIELTMQSQQNGQPQSTSPAGGVGGMEGS